MRISDWSSDVCSSDLWHLLRAKCEDALALVSSVRDGILPIADVFGQGHCEEGFGRALDEEDHRSVRSAAERRHEAVRGIEWNLVEPLPFRALQFRIDRRLHRQIGRAHVCTPDT